jgi:hypothetical protein
VPASCGKSCRGDDGPNRLRHVPGGKIDQRLFHRGNQFLYPQMLPDLFFAFLTANPNVANPDEITHSVETIPNDNMDPIFAGVVQATEEAIVNALIDNQSMTGRDNHHVDALPHDRVRELLKNYGRPQ